MLFAPLEINIYLTLYVKKQRNRIGTLHIFILSSRQYDVKAAKGQMGNVTKKT